MPVLEDLLMDNKKYLLPYGDQLREFLIDGNVPKSDLRGILRRRGVFTLNDDKAVTVPILVRTGISPIELMELHENIKESEDEPKSHTQSVKCKTMDFDLLTVVPNSEEIHNLIKKPFTNYELIGVPNFSNVEESGDVAELTFTIERTDHTKSWDKNTKQFSGKVRFSKEGGDVDINISLSHTSAETKEVASVISKEIVKRLKNNGHVDEDEEIRKIRFNDFTNANRVKFLNELSKKQTEYGLYFKDTRDLGFSPDNSSELPSDISWMQEKISNLIIQGKDLHSTFFISNKSYHEFIKIYKVEASYSFDYDDCSGSCQVSYEFPEFLNKQDITSELLIRVQNIRFKDPSKKLFAGKVKERALRILEKPKLKLHDELKKNTE
jgi:hypothetical protein